MPKIVEGGWQIGAHTYAENPRYTCPRWALILVSTWWQIRSARGGGMAGIGPAIMPRGGGYCDQPALAMEAFALFENWLGEGQTDGREA